MIILFIQIVIIAFMFGIVKSDTIWLKRRSKESSLKFGAIFKRQEEHTIGIALNKQEIKNIKDGGNSK